MALNLLKEEFFDKEFIIDETLNILKAMPSEEYDPEFLNIKYYLSEIKSYLYELQQYNVNFFFFFFLFFFTGRFSWKYFNSSHDNE